ncbi:MAG: cytochrome c-type biogenesis protein [Acidimicrobiales bacterium]
MNAPGNLVRWVAVVAAAVGLLLVATIDSGGAETDAERIQRLSDSFACPQCQGESVSESSAAVAATIRDFIAAEVAAGATDEEIRDDLIAGYGGRVLLTPPAEGIASLVWILPVVVLTGGAAAAAAVFAGRERNDVTVTDADRELVEQALSARAQDEADDG